MSPDKYSLINKALSYLAPPQLRGEVFIADFAGRPIDLKKIEPYVKGTKQPQVHGFIIRAILNKQVDAYVLQNYPALKSLGVPVGLYGVHRPTANMAANKEQGQRFAGVIDTIGEYPDLWAWGDWEIDPENLDISTMRRAILKYIDGFEGEFDEIPSGKLPAYSNSWWDREVANSTNGNTDIPFKRPYWAASWYGTKPYIPYDWRIRYGTESLDAWVLWQTDNRWIIDGIGNTGNVDGNTFNGGLLAFYDYFNLSHEPPPPPPGGDDLKFRATATPHLNVRTGPSTNYADVGNILPGTEFAVLDIKAGAPACSTWLQIKGGEFDGKWVCLVLNGQYYAVPV